jgi:hypothetical protein
MLSKTIHDLILVYSIYTKEISEHVVGPSNPGAL